MGTLTTPQFYRAIAFLKNRHRLALSREAPDGETRISVDGQPLGTLSEVVHGAAQDLLVVDHDGREVFVPFVSELVPEVDLAGRRVVIDDRPGLFAEPTE